MGEVFGVVVVVGLFVVVLCFVINFECLMVEVVVVVCVDDEEFVKFMVMVCEFGVIIFWVVLEVV